MQTGKKCTVCKVDKTLDNFSQRSNRPLGQLHSACRECRNKVSLRCWYAKHDENLKYGRDYKKANRTKVNAQKRAEYQRQKTDPLYKLDASLRHGLLRCRKGSKKTKHDDVYGMASDDLYVHLMVTALDTYGYWSAFERYDVDHRIPRCTATTEDELKRLYHFSNLQLLKPEDNRAKGRSIS